MTASLRLSGHQTLDIATYSCPWVNTWVLSQIPAYFSVCPRISLLYSCLIKSFYLLCDLLMVIANPSFTGNCLRYQVNGYSGRMLKLYITFVPVIRSSKHFWLLQCIWHQTMVIYSWSITICSHWNHCLWSQELWEHKFLVLKWSAIL